MQCHEASELMSLRLDVSLAAEQEAAFQQHLVGCEQCRAEWAWICQACAVLEQAGLAAPSPAFADQVMAKVRRRAARLSLARGTATFILGLAIIAAIAFAPLLAILSLANTVASNPSVVNAMIEVLLKGLAIAGTLLQAARLVFRVMLAGSNWLVLIAYIGLAALLGAWWFRLVVRPAGVASGTRESRWMH